jgi:hypothetical protein
MARPKSTAELIGMTAEHGRILQPVEEYWTHLFNGKFEQTYRAALETTVLPMAKIDEAVEVMRVHLERISDGVAQANYSLREMATELDAVRREADRSGDPQSRFKI